MGPFEGQRPSNISDLQLKLFKITTPHKIDTVQIRNICTLPLAIGKIAIAWLSRDVQVLFAKTYPRVYHNFFNRAQLVQGVDADVHQDPSVRESGRAHQRQVVQRL